MSWAKCNECGGEVWFDAWVDLNGELAGGPYDNTHCETCGGEASYTEVEGDPPDSDDEEWDDDDTEEEDE